MVDFILIFRPPLCGNRTIIYKGKLITLRNTIICKQFNNNENKN